MSTATRTYQEGDRVRVVSWNSRTQPVHNKVGVVVDVLSDEHFEILLQQNPQLRDDAKQAFFVKLDEGFGNPLMDMLFPGVATTDADVIPEDEPFDVEAEFIPVPEGVRLFVQGDRVKVTCSGHSAEGHTGTVVFARRVHNSEAASLDLQFMSVGKDNPHVNPPQLVAVELDEPARGETVINEVHEGLELLA